MKLTITKEKENKLLKRTEIEAEIEYEGATPSNDVIKDKISEVKKAEKDLIVTKGIYSLFGKTKCKVIVDIYESKEAMGEIEPKPKKKEEKK